MSEKPIEHYEHVGKERYNNPPVGLVTPETDTETEKRTYQYDPHLDPTLQWAGKAEHTSFEVPTQSLHVHERIDPRTIIKAVRKGKLDEFIELDGLTQGRILFLVLEQGHMPGLINKAQYFETVFLCIGSIDSDGTEKIAMWMLDIDYDGRGLYPKQVFFPWSGKKDGWSRLAKNLKTEIDTELIEAYRGTLSLPFKLGENKRIAVKIVNDRGY